MLIKSWHNKVLTVIWHRLVSTCCWYLISREVMGIVCWGSWVLLWLTGRLVSCRQQQPGALHLTIASGHCCYSSVPLSCSSSAPSPSSLLLFLLMCPSVLLFAPYSGQFSSSLLTVVDRQYLHYGLLFLPRKALARPGGCQMSWNAGSMGGGIQMDSH